MSAYGHVDRALELLTEALNELDQAKASAPAYAYGSFRFVKCEIAVIATRLANIQKAIRPSRDPAA